MNDDTIFLKRKFKVKNDNSDTVYWIDNKDGSGGKFIFWSPKNEGPPTSAACDEVYARQCFRDGIWYWIEEEASVTKIYSCEECIRQNDLIIERLDLEEIMEAAGGFSTEYLNDR